MDSDITNNVQNLRINQYILPQIASKQRSIIIVFFLDKYSIKYYATNQEFEPRYTIQNKITCIHGKLTQIENVLMESNEEGDAEDRHYPELTKQQTDS